MTFFILVAGVIAASSAFMSVFYIPPLNISENNTNMEKLKDLDNWLSNLNKKGRFNGTVLLARDDKILFNNSYGFQDVDETISLSENSSFNLASVSKQFTSMAIVLLSYKGKLSYQDNITDYIPELGLFENVTIENLLHHTSGIPDYISLAGKEWNEDKILKTTDVISILKSSASSPEFSPGSKFKYSNTGYVLLAEIVKRVSGESFADFMKDNVFLPSEMNHSSVFNLLSDLEPENRVYGYKKSHWLFGGRKQLKDLNYLDGVSGDGAVYSSGLDLFKWNRAISEGKIVPKAEYDQAFESGRLNDGKETGYGYGWFVKGKGVVEHAGGWQGFASYIYKD
ncbi:MAG: beta-lactamase family protein, partial [Gammaproteobacteria bacterium]|nr:beta-lactamase family protein [Gammaproteobacteria bacterium]